MPVYKKHVCLCNSTYLRNPTNPTYKPTSTHKYQHTYKLANLRTYEPTQKTHNSCLPYPIPRNLKPQHTESSQDIETTQMTQPACFLTHTDEASTQPASIVNINH